MSLTPDTTTQEYVEIIHDLQKKYKVARVKDIAKMRGVSRSSVSTVLNALKKKNLIVHEQYGLVQLTEKGKRLGRTLSRRHEAIFDLLVEILNVSPEIAEADACQVEHCVSSETIDRIINFLEFVKQPSSSQRRCLPFLAEFRQKYAKSSS